MWQKHVKATNAEIVEQGLGLESVSTFIRSPDFDRERFVEARFPSTLKSLVIGPRAEWQLQTVDYQGRLPLRRSQCLVLTKALGAVGQLNWFEEKLNTRNQHSRLTHTILSAVGLWEGSDRPGSCRLS